MATALVPMHCKASDGEGTSTLRKIAAGLLIAIGLVETAGAALLLIGSHAAPAILFFLAALTVFFTSIKALNASPGTLRLLQNAAVVGAIAAIWASGGGPHAGPSITFAGSTHSLTPLLVAMLFAAVLLTRLVRRSRADAACNCH